jgi:hypothetical protein
LPNLILLIKNASRNIKSKLPDISNIGWSNISLSETLIYVTWDMFKLNVFLLLVIENNRMDAYPDISIEKLITLIL